MELQELSSGLSSNHIKMGSQLCSWYDSLTQNKAYIVTGGNDSCVKVWGRSNHNMLTQLELFNMPVTRVIADFKDPAVIHACSLNKDIVSFDLKKNKQIILHRVANGHVNDMVQKKCPEFEISSMR